MSRGKKIRVGISCGDFNGIGMEIVLKTFSDARIMDHCVPVIYASKQVFEYYNEHSGLDKGSVRFIQDTNRLDMKKINVMSCWKEKVKITPGESTSEAGACAFKSLKMAAEDIASTKVDVMVTAPINKHNMQSEEFNFPGHTEFLADYANEENPLMILVNDALRVALVTGHIPVSKVTEALSVKKIAQKLQVLNKSLQQDFGISRPRIAVLGLNPHNGDKGLMGDEEAQIIGPAIASAQKEGILAFGPFPADGFFGSSSVQKFDAVLAMYHDQGLAPFKALAFENGVNFTAGLPIVRTSPDHGVAYDIAGTGQASEASFRQAVFAACDIYRSRAESRELNANSLKQATASAAAS